MEKKLIEDCLAMLRDYKGALECKEEMFENIKKDLYAELCKVRQENTELHMKLIQITDKQCELIKLKFRGVFKGELKSKDDFAEYSDEALYSCLKCHENLKRTAELCQSAANFLTRFYDLDKIESRTERTTYANPESSKKLRAAKESSKAQSKGVSGHSRRTAELTRTTRSKVVSPVVSGKQHTQATLREEPTAGQEKLMEVKEAQGTPKTSAVVQPLVDIISMLKTGLDMSRQKEEQESTTRDDETVVKHAELQTDITGESSYSMNKSMVEAVESGNSFVPITESEDKLKKTTAPPEDVTNVEDPSASRKDVKVKKEQTTRKSKRTARASKQVPKQDEKPRLSTKSHQVKPASVRRTIERATRKRTTSVARRK